MDLIYLLVKDLNQNVMQYRSKEIILGHRPDAGYDTDKNKGDNKTAIRRQILDIRQQLLELDKCFR